MYVICFVDPEDPAIAVLVEHFRSVVGSIVDDRWRHFASRWVSGESKKKVSVMGLQELNKALELNRQPTPFFLGYHRLGHKLQDLREKVVVSLRKFDFDVVTPLVTEIFSADFVGIASSGVDELFPPPRRGRPRKADQKSRKRPRDDDLDYLPQLTLPRSIRRRRTKRFATGKGSLADVSSETDNKVLPIADILLQARDIKSTTVNVFVQWEGLPLNESQWIPLRQLTQDTAAIWLVDRETRYASFTDGDFPDLPISGAVPISDSTTETDLPSSSSSSTETD